MTHRDSGRADLIAGLNEDLAHEYGSVIRYRTFASAVRGPARVTLRPLFTREVGDELSHAGLLADSIVALDGTPTVNPAPVSVAVEPAEMLRSALEAECAALAGYVERRQQAEALGEHGLAVALDSVIADETRHRDEFRLMLAGWTEPVTTEAVTADEGITARDVRRQTAWRAGVAPADVRSADEQAVSGEAVAPRPPWPSPEQAFDAVSEASIDSFPASDSPPWTGMRLGPPR